MTSLGERWAGAVVLGTLLFVSLSAFVYIATGIASGHWAGFDRALILAIRTLDGPVADTVMPAITRMGGVYPVSAVVILAAAWAWRLSDFRAAAAILVAGMLTAELTSRLQGVFARQRPTLAVKIAPIHNYGFPSGHAIAGFAIYGTLALVLARRRPRWRVGVAVGGALLAFLIGLSRVYLGVHWPSDVAAGWALGAAVVLISRAILGRPRPSPMAD